MKVTKERQFERIISDGVEYGIHLEDGTTTILPRPFIGPVITDWGNRRFIDRFRDIMP